MERYNIITEVGDGTFGSVWRAINKESGEVVCHSACPIFACYALLFAVATFVYVVMPDVSKLGAVYCISTK